MVIRAISTSSDMTKSDEMLIKLMGDKTMPLHIKVNLLEQMRVEGKINNITVS